MAKTARHRKNTSKKQKMYKMKGCSHLARKTEKCPLCGKKGGSPDMPLAYTGQMVPSVPNPYLAYTRQMGGVKHMGQMGGVKQMGYMGGVKQMGQMGYMGGVKQMGGNKFAYNNTQGILAVNKLPVGSNLNASFQRGGGVIGGPGGIPGYQPAAFYPDGTVGNSWTPATGGLPGVDGVSSNRNFLSLNTYPNDPQTQNIIDERTVYNYGLKGGRSREARGGKYRTKSKKARRGGALLGLNQMIPTDILNPLRSTSYNLQGSLAAMQGRTQPPSPLPENSQLLGTPTYNSLSMFR